MDYFKQLKYSEKDFEVLVSLLNPDNEFLKATLKAFIKKGYFNKIIDLSFYKYDKNLIEKILHASFSDMPLYINEDSVSILAKWRIAIGK